jgi:hypothetical protein
VTSAPPEPGREDTVATEGPRTQLRIRSSSVCDFVMDQFNCRQNEVAAERPLPPRRSRGHEARPKGMDRSHPIQATRFVGLRLCVDIRRDDYNVR